MGHGPSGSVSSLDRVLAKGRCEHAAALVLHSRYRRSFPALCMGFFAALPGFLSPRSEILLRFDRSFLHPCAVLQNLIKPPCAVLQKNRKYGKMRLCSMQKCCQLHCGGAGYAATFFCDLGAPWDFCIFSQADPADAVVAPAFFIYMGGCGS